MNACGRAIIGWADEAGSVVFYAAQGIALVFVPLSVRAAIRAVFSVRAAICAISLFSDASIAEVTIENPSTGSIQSGIMLIHGWSDGSQQLRVLIDDEFVTNLRAETIRADVNPNIETGFSMAFNYDFLEDGQHTLTVTDAMTGKSDSVSFSTIRLYNHFVEDYADESLKYFCVH